MIGEKAYTENLGNQIKVVGKNLAASKKAFENADKMLNETLLQTQDIEELENSFNKYIETENFVIQNIRSAVAFYERFQNEQGNCKKHVDIDEPESNFNDVYCISRKTTWCRRSLGSKLSKS
jgi:seryl-tRNA synthetase